MAGTNRLDWRLDIGRTRSLDIVGMPLLDHYVTTLGLACSPASTSCTSTI